MAPLRVVRVAAAALVALQCECLSPVRGAVRRSGRRGAWPVAARRPAAEAGPAAEAEGEGADRRSVLGLLGPLVPLAFGAFWEVSAGVRRFVEMLAGQRAEQFLKHDRARAFEGEKSVAVGYIRRRLSFVGARARAQLRLQRLRQVEVGSAAEVGRRQKRWSGRRRISRRRRQRRLCARRRGLPCSRWQLPPSTEHIGCARSASDTRGPMQWQRLGMQHAQQPLLRAQSTMPAQHAAQQQAPL